MLSTHLRDKHGKCKHRTGNLSIGQDLHNPNKRGRIQMKLPKLSADQTQDAASHRSLSTWLKHHKKLLIAMAIIFAAVGVFFWQKNRASKAMSGALDYQYVRTTVLKSDSFNDSVTVTGTVRSGDEADVTVSDAAKTCKVATVNVEVGDTVQEGDVIATLDTSDLESQLKSARQSYSDTLAQAQTSYDRAVDEYNTATVQHENNLIDLQAKIDTAEQNLSDAEDALSAAKSNRDAAQSTYDAANADYNTISAAYEQACSSISTFTDALNSAADAQNAAITALNAAIAAYNADGSEANRQAMNDASAALAEAQQNYANAQNELTQAQNSCSVSSLGLYSFSEIERAWTTAGQTRSSAESALNQADNAVESAENQVESCESQLKSAHDSYDNEKNYSNIKSRAQSVEDAKTKLEQAQRKPDNLTTLEETLADCTLTATMSGTITELNATVGSVCAGTVATIQNTDALVLEVTLASDDVPTLSVGMNCLITSDATGEAEIPGTLVQIDPVANDQGTFGGKIRVTGSDSGLLIGVQAKAEIIRSAVENVFTVPLDAVGENADGSNYVLRKTGGEGTDMTFEEVPVTTGESNDYYVVITGDTLAEGDVIRSSADLTEGIESTDSETANDPTQDIAMPGMGGDMGSGAEMGTMPGGDRPDGNGGRAPGGM